MTFLLEFVAGFIVAHVLVPLATAAVAGVLLYWVALPRVIPDRLPRAVLAAAIGIIAGALALLVIPTPG